MKSGIKAYGTVFLAMLLAACGGTSNPTGQAPPIKMGDPATIVTETDSQYLTDVVNDLNMASNRPITIAAATKDTAQTPVADTPKPASAPVAAEAPATAKGDGLRVPFPQAKLFIPGIKTKTYKEPNLETDYGASYEIVGGELQGNQLVVEGKNIEDVYMRYQTIVVARNDLGTLPLESLRKLTDWKKIQGKNGVYKIDGLDKKKLEGIKVSNKAIRNAVTRDAKSRRLSRNATQQWLNSVKKTNNTSQKPLNIELRSVMWKVSGKDANGRPFQRQLRIDVPIQP